MAIAGMHELRSLQLTHNNLTNQGLAGILDSCIHLKLLDLLNCYNIHMTPEMEARIKTKTLIMNNRSVGRWDSFDEPDSTTSEWSFKESTMSECSTCFNYFRFGYSQELYPIDQKEAMVISAVRELRSLELYRNDRTSKGLTAILDKCPHLEPIDVWNCLNIIRNNNNALRAKWHQMKINKKLTTLRATPIWHRIKAKKLTTKLLLDRSNPNVFNPECLDIHNCLIVVKNSSHGRNIMENTLGAKYKQLRKWVKTYHERTKKMKASTEEYLAKLPGCNVDYMDFEGVKFKTYNYWDKYWEFYNVEFELGSPTSECSTCLMFEYLAGRRGVLDLDDYSDYYDSSYGLDVYDEIECQVHDRMLGKRFHRYLKME